MNTPHTRPLAHLSFALEKWNLRSFLFEWLYLTTDHCLSLKCWDQSYV